MEEVFGGLGSMVIYISINNMELRYGRYFGEGTLKIRIPRFSQQIEQFKDLKV